MVKNNIHRDELRNIYKQKSYYQLAGTCSIYKRFYLEHPLKKNFIKKTDFLKFFFS